MAVADLRKAAVFLLSLPRPQTEALLRRLPPMQAKVVAGEMAKLGKPAADEQQAVLQEFAGRSRAEPAREPERQRPFDYLFGKESTELLAILGEEHPQTIAVVLSYLPVTQAAEALAALPTSLQTSVISRISSLAALDGEVVHAVSEALRQRIFGKTRTPKIERGLSNVVKMLNAMQPAKERRLLNEIGTTDPELLAEIRCAMFGPDVAACGQWSPLAAAS